jgi:hypothetical protein
MASYHHTHRKEVAAEKSQGSKKKRFARAGKNLGNLKQSGKKLIYRCV